jgi:putative acetyltransferase
LAKLSVESRELLADGREICVRGARPRDARSLARLVESVAQEPQPTLLMLPEESTARLWRRRVAAARLDFRSLWVVGTLGGELVGNLGLERDAHPNSEHVAWVGVSVGCEWRGLGVGSALLATAVDWAVANGVEKLALGVFPENARALAFYERHGFAREGSRRAHYRRGGQFYDEVLMARFLVPVS